jgi:DNA-binding CsgD family transcriptional regulator
MPRKLSCEKCRKRNTCTTLCDRVKKYVNQDVVGPLYDYMPVRATWMKHPLPSGIRGGPFYVSWDDLAARYGEDRFDLPFLSEIERRCLHLYHQEALSYKQIAQKVRKKTSTVRGIMSRARKKIKDHARVHKFTR